MSLKMKRIRLFFLVVCFLGLIGVFQSCDTYGESELLSENDIGECGNDIDGVCSGLHVFELELRIKSPSLLEVPRGATAFDVGGDCFAPGFAQTVVQWDLVHTANKELLATSGDLNTTSCDATGRFRILVTLPNSMAMTALHTLTVKVSGVDSATGGLIGNPNNLHIKTINTQYQ